MRVTRSAFNYCREPTFRLDFQQLSLRSNYPLVVHLSPELLATPLRLSRFHRRFPGSLFFIIVAISSTISSILFNIDSSEKRKKKLSSVRFFFYLDFCSSSFTDHQQKSRVLLSVSIRFVCRESSNHRCTIYPEET